MDQPTSAPSITTPPIAVEPGAEVSAPKKRRSSILLLTLAVSGLLASIGAVGVTTWSTAQTQREILRLSTDLAQLRVSIELYAQNGSGAASMDAESLASLESRLDALEQDASSAAVPTPATATTLPALPPATASGEDCLPAGMRLLVAMGDSYAICGQSATVEVSMVDNGYITLADGTTIPSGGAMPLPNSACTIGVTSNGDEGLTGYAEIRVTC